MNNVAGLWHREDPPRWLARSACAIAACAFDFAILTNFRRKLSVFKQGVRLNFIDFHQFSSELASFQIRSAPQFHRCSPIFVETGQFWNKECASISPIFTNFRRNWPVFKKGVRLNFTDFRSEEESTSTSTAWMSQWETSRQQHNAWVTRTCTYFISEHCVSDACMCNFVAAFGTRWWITAVSLLDNGCCFLFVFEFETLHSGTWELWQWYEYMVGWTS